MKRTMLLPFLAAICAAGLAWGAGGAAQQRVELTDPTGDAEGDAEDPGKDVVKLVLDSDGELLLIEASLAREASYYLDGHKAGDVVVLVLDTDGDAATGGAIMFGKKPGFDMEVAVRACIAYGGSGEACVGGLGDLKATEFFSSFKVGRFAQGEPFAETTHDVFWKSPRQPITGKVVRAAVPYAELGLKSGQTVRIAVREADGGVFEEAYFPEVLLTLK